MDWLVVHVDLGSLRHGRRPRPMEGDVVTLAIVSEVSGAWLTLKAHWEVSLIEGGWHDEWNRMDLLVLHHGGAVGLWKQAWAHQAVHLSTRQVLVELSGE